jgi:hypothetical protein
MSMSNERTGRTRKGLAAMILAALAVMGLGGAALAQSDSTPAPAVTDTQDQATDAEAAEAPAAEAPRRPTKAPRTTPRIQC